MATEHSSTARRGLMAAGAIGAALFIVGLWQDVFGLRLITKPIPIVCMMIGLRLTARDRYATRILIGLVFSLIGDLLLEASPDLFVPGLLAFLLAQVWYIAAFLGATRALKLWRLLPFAGWGIIVYAILLPNLGGMALPVGAYVIVICVMMWRASALEGGGTAARAALIGAVLFALSDTLIALNKFGAPIEGAHYWIIILYWLGQLGITLSARRAVR